MDNSQMTNACTYTKPFWARLGTARQERPPLCPVLKSSAPCQLQLTHVRLHPCPPVASCYIPLRAQQRPLVIGC